MPKPPRQIRREKCVVCLEWNLPKDMYTKFICVYCIKEGRKVPIKKES